MVFIEKQRIKIEEEGNFHEFNDAYFDPFTEFSTINDNVNDHGNHNEWSRMCQNVPM